MRIWRPEHAKPKPLYVAARFPSSPPLFDVVGPTHFEDPPTLYPSALLGVANAPPNLSPPSPIQLPVQLFGVDRKTEPVLHEDEHAVPVAGINTI